MGELGYQYTKPRRPIGAMYSSPGPVYMLPPLIGEKGHDMRSTFTKAPSYSLAKQLIPLGSDRSPGPAAYPQNGKYTNTGEATSPMYTITGIPKELKTGQFPGPADYNVDPGKKLVFPTSPSYLMGARLRGLRTDDTPAPNAYSLPAPSKRSENPTAPSYTMAGRNDANTLVLNKNPGPADYSVGSPDLLAAASPKYTMGITLPERRNANFPGPLTYRAEDFPKIMCHWGRCQALQSVRRCKFCGTQFCIECGRGDFPQTMVNFDRCIVCHAADFQEMVPEPRKRRPPPDENAKSKKRRGTKGKGGKKKP